MFLLIDNYDSFTWNLAQAFQSLGKNPVVLRNDDPEIMRLAEDPELEMVCISPGPGHPADAGLCPQFLHKLDPQVPVLGICLGHQLLGLHAGADIGIAPVIMHGKQSEIRHDCAGMYRNLPNPLKVGRYHSLVVMPTPEADKKFTVTSRGPRGEIMGLRYNDRPWVGAQFHPESVLTPEGMEFLANFPDALQVAPKAAFSLIIDKLANGEDLDEAMATQAFADLMDGNLTAAQAGSLLLGLRAKGETALELACASRCALARSVPVYGLPESCIDIVGTGGDGKNSFNCSTATALLLAGMGYKVAKHGNRAVSSACGAADALEGLGFRLEADPAAAVRQLDEKNFTFFFAPHYHPSFKNIGPIRRELGIRTLFNILGPLINPARPDYLLMGVARPELVPLIAETLAYSGLKRAAVVCGAGGYDEVTPMGKSEAAIVGGGKITTLTIDPANYGMQPCSEADLACNDRQEALARLRELIAGGGPQPMRDMVALNAALALHLLDPDTPFDAAVQKARENLLAGAAKRVVDNAG
ncbi:MAG: anthranilate phosphoribosyltransferase [Desulfovibrio sp.]|nr:anthranilate phosphoribosyltransferase [Desulfovibrio sp.]